MGHAQWIEMTVRNKIGIRNLRLQSAVAKCGKFHCSGHKDRPLSCGDVDCISICPGCQASFGACGMWNSASGTEGSFAIFDGALRVATVRWDCPYDRNTSQLFVVEKENDDYVVGSENCYRDAGSIGAVTITVGKQ